MHRSTALPIELAPRAVRLRDGRDTCVRPVRTGDVALIQAFVEQSLSPASRRQRFHHGVTSCTPRMLRDLATADGERHVAFIATLLVDGQEQMVGEARYVVSGDHTSSAEFAIAVADARLGQGLADRLVETLIASARRQGLCWLHGDVLAGNERMLAFMRRMGFVACDHGLMERCDGLVRVERSVVAAMPDVSPRVTGPVATWRRLRHHLTCTRVAGAVPG